MGHTPELPLSCEQIAEAMVKEAIRTDAAETERHGALRGDEPPEVVATTRGREGWLRDARQRLDQRRAQQARPIARSRPVAAGGKRRLEEDLDFEHHANANFETYYRRGVMRDGRRMSARPTPYTSLDVPAGKVNLTDPGSKLVHGMRGRVQGYNAQALCNEHYLIVGAEVTTASSDFGISLRCSPRRAASSPRPASAKRRGSCSPTPATDISSR
jgi:hypothetical protein